MAVATGRKCARCGFPLDGAFRFCPGCALPAGGSEVLSTEIAARRFDAARLTRSETPGRRMLQWTGAAMMLAVVGGIGVVLFDRGILEEFLGTAGDPVVDVEPDRRPFEPEWCDIPAGTFIAGDALDPLDDLQWVYEPFAISKYEIPNRLWQQFLIERGAQLRELDILRESTPRGAAGWERLPDGTARPGPDHMNKPVRDVIPLAVALFCEWLTGVVGEEGVEIRLPSGIEWEYAARGWDGRTYPWGEEFAYLLPLGRTGTSNTRPPQIGLGREPANVDAIDDDVSVPFGVVGMGTNVSEMVIYIPTDVLTSDERLYDLMAERRVFVWSAGASYVNTLSDAAQKARVASWRERDLEARTRFDSVGFRVVKARRRQ